MLIAHICGIGADIVGLHECQDASGIATASGYSLLSSFGNGNTKLYKSNVLEMLDSGWFNIPRDVSIFIYIPSILQPYPSLITATALPPSRTTLNVTFHGASKYLTGVAS